MGIAQILAKTLRDDICCQGIACLHRRANQGKIFITHAQNEHRSQAHGWLDGRPIFVHLGFPSHQLGGELFSVMGFRAIN